MTHYSYQKPNADHFEGAFDSPEDAAVAALHEIDDEETTTVTVGENVEQAADSFIDIDNILEEIQCRACDEIGEVAEDWLTSFSKDKKAELEKLIADWIEANDPPTFWSVINTRDITRAELIATGHLQQVQS